jgi:hypothetical protein
MYFRGLHWKKYPVCGSDIWKTTPHIMRNYQRNKYSPGIAPGYFPARNNRYEHSNSFKGVQEFLPYHGTGRIQNKPGI